MYRKDSKEGVVLESASESKRRSNEERSRSTRTALINAARRLFEDRGYANTGTEEIVSEAGVTRGALYHHFRDKEDLFRAVVEAIQLEVAGDAAEAWDEGGDLWERFTTVGLDFFERIPQKTVRLMFIDGPAVLGYRQWRELDDAVHLPPLMVAIERAIADGKLPEQNAEGLARVLIALVNALGTMLAESDDINVDDILPLWQRMLAGLASDA